MTKTAKEQLRFEYEARETLLRKQLNRTTERHARCAQRLALARKIIEWFLQLNFPVLHGQAKAQGMDVFEEADKIRRHLQVGRDLAETFRRDKSTTPAEQTASDATDYAGLSPTLTSEAAITALRILGKTADYDVATLRWARALDVPDVPALKAHDLERMQVLRDAFTDLIAGEELKPLVNKVYVETPGNLAKVQAQYLVYLTDAGVHEYQIRFGGQPMREVAPVSDEAREGEDVAHAFIRPQTYPSEECWWWTRAIKALIELGNRAEQAPFSYTVYDPVCGPFPAEFKRRYPTGRRNDKGSEPDLIVVMEPRGGTTVRVVIEVERAKYTPTRLKSKIWKNVGNYMAAGFDGVYYLAPSRPFAKKLRTAVNKVKEDAEKTPDAIPPSILAVFRGAKLVNAWLPSPSQVDRWGQTPPDRYAQMAPVFHYYKHKGR
jgi:hypothetical protein